MEKVSGNVFAETKIRGCNPGYVVTSDGVVVIDAPQLPTHAVKMRKEVESHGPVCTKTYIPIQSAFIREWVTAVAVGIA
nr:hypothetical protein [Candidatus Njordarchaeum guaymaensis]